VTAICLQQLRIGLLADAQHNRNQWISSGWCQIRGRSGFVGYWFLADQLQ
jgi:hypothetical protein